MAPAPSSPYNEATDGPPERGGLPAATKRLEDSMEHLTQLVVSESELGNIARILGRLTMETGASHVLLLDKSGQLVSAQGQTDQRDIIALGALLAGAFSSSRQVAQILGEKDFCHILQQGVHESIYTSLIGAQWPLVVVFDRPTQLGLGEGLGPQVPRELQ